MKTLITLITILLITIVIIPETANAQRHPSAPGYHGAATADLNGDGIISDEEANKTINHNKNARKVDGSRNIRGRANVGGWNLWTGRTNVQVQIQAPQPQGIQVPVYGHAVNGCYYSSYDRIVWLPQSSCVTHLNNTALYGYTVIY